MSQLLLLWVLLRIPQLVMNTLAVVYDVSIVNIVVINLPVVSGYIGYWFGFISGIGVPTCWGCHYSADHTTVDGYEQ